jgi:hypothetical protein
MSGHAHTCRGTVSDECNDLLTSDGKTHNKGHASLIPAQQPGKPTKVMLAPALPLRT